MLQTSLIIIFVAVFAVILLVVFWLTATYNNFIKLKNKTEEAYSAMDVSLKKRYDLLPNYVETVKGYARHEKETLDAVISARNSAANAQSPQERIDHDNRLSHSMKSLFAVAEAYPDLKANNSFVEMQRQLQRIEEEIAGARRYYNGVVNKYNTKTEMFPGNLLAGMFGFSRKPLYEVNETEERENIKISF